jgi:hypothetical protein
VNSRDRATPDQAGDHLALVAIELARIIQTLSSRKPRFGVTGLRFRRFPDTPLHHRR